MIILGLNAYHGDSAAALVVDGELCAAAEEERFRRIKHWAGFPEQAIRYCLQQAGIELADVDHIAINQDPSAHRREKLMFAMRGRVSPATLFDRIAKRRKRAGLEIVFDNTFPSHGFKGKFHAVEHHRAHLSSAFHVSPFEEALAVSVDGFGDFSSAAWGVGRGSDIHIQHRVLFPHSLGIFYQALTQYLGFPHYGDEYKVMGLAPYGEPAYLEQMRRIVHLQDDGGYRLNLDYFVHQQGNQLFELDGGQPAVQNLYSDKLAELLGPVRDPAEPLTQHHHNIARSVQVMYEEAFFHLLNTAHREHPLNAVVVSGGCGMNSVANGKIMLKTPFTEVYVQSAAGDAGGAIGSAFSVWHELGGKRHWHMPHAYWGPEYDATQIGQLLAERSEALSSAHCEVTLIDENSDLCARTAQHLSDGLVVGWFQGRMEWGPRALGNRSILGDPRRSDMKDILNLKIKRRESFRPFAPSVLREHVPGWFEQDGDVPFMMQVYQIREERRGQIPAITHVDGSGRLQTVSAENNPRYHQLISAFHALTNVPMVLNTSFNENEPVVCTPAEALDCFLRTNMDVLVLGNHMITR